MTGEVFIIESLRKADHEEGRLEGGLINQLLRMGGREPIYKLVETEEQLTDAIRSFGESGYRYLHLSCHGSEKAFEFYFGSMPFEKLVGLLDGRLENKRIFVSACEAVNEHLATLLIPSTRCYSVVGPFEAIRFDDAAIMWTSYYYLAFKNEMRRMDRKLIVRTLNALTKLYEVNLNYYSISRKTGVKVKQFRTN